MIKDLYTYVNSRKGILLMLAMGILFSISFNDGGNYLSIMLTLMLMMSVYTSFSYDESANWDRYAVSLPVPRYQIVLCKYIMMILSAVASMLVTVVVSLVTSLISGNGDVLSNIYMSLTNIGVMMLALTIVIPFSFKLGAQKARLVSIFGFVVPMLAIIFISQFIPGVMQNPALLETIMAIAFPVLLVVACPISFLCAVHIYKNKEF